MQMTQEMWVKFLRWEDSLEEGMATHFSILAWRIPVDRGAWWAAVHRVAELDTTTATSHACMHVVLTRQFASFL